MEFLRKSLEDLIQQAWQIGLWPRGLSMTKEMLREFCSQTNPHERQTINGRDYWYTDFGSVEIITHEPDLGDDVRISFGRPPGRFLRPLVPPREPVEFEQMVERERPGA